MHSLSCVWWYAFYVFCVGFSIKVKLPCIYYIPSPHIIGQGRWGSWEQNWKYIMSWSFSLNVKNLQQFNFSKSYWSYPSWLKHLLTWRKCDSLQQMLTSMVMLIQDKKKLVNSLAALGPLCYGIQYNFLALNLKDLLEDHIQRNIENKRKELAMFLRGLHCLIHTPHLSSYVMINLPFSWVSYETYVL